MAIHVSFARFLFLRNSEYWSFSRPPFLSLLFLPSCACACARRRVGLRARTRTYVRRRFVRAVPAARNPKGNGGKDTREKTKSCSGV